MKPKLVLVTGAAGYIGSVICKLLTERGYNVLANDLKVPRHNYHIARLVCSFDQISKHHLENLDAIFHLAASADVPDSVANPLKYYENNTAKTITLIKKLKEIDWRGNFIFSSTAAVYGEKMTEFVESDPKTPINPYGHSKLMCEQVLMDSGLRYSIFRYFNVAGAHVTVGDHLDSNHVVQRLCDAALNKKEFKIFGHNLNTRDGTCIRDYIHVLDVARAHLFIDHHMNNGGTSDVYNLGMNDGISVRQIVDTFETVNNVDINVVVSDPRPGDPRILVASPKKIVDIGFDFEYNLEDMLSSAWRYYKGDLNAV